MGKPESIKVAYSLYELENVLKTASFPCSRKGALLKIEDEMGNIGYSDCHPWPELGDLPLNDQLIALSKNTHTPLTRQALLFAEMDAKNRAAQKNLLNHQLFPKSHFLITDMFNFSTRQVSCLIEQGYTHVKLKAGREIDQEVDCLRTLFFNTPLKLRLDFNEKLTPKSFNLFLKKIKELRDRIDFIEDPFPFNKVQWSVFQKQGLSLACDRQMMRAKGCAEAAKILVLKPAIQPFLGFKRPVNQSLIITTYLGHPVGQTAAAFVASQLDPFRLNVHGLLSHHAYLQTSFSEKLNWKSPLFIPPPGFGLGFDNDFDQLQWSSLV